MGTFLKSSALVTSARTPFALDLIRKLNQSGVKTFAADTFYSAPGCRSNHAHKSFKINSPRFNTKEFIEDIKNIVKIHNIECIIPTFEEAIYLAQVKDYLNVPIMCPDLKWLLLLHDQEQFLNWLALDTLALGSQLSKYIAAPNLEGQKISTYSLCHNGSIQAHSAYVYTPGRNEVMFESIEDEESLFFAQKVAEATNYQGHLSFEFCKTEDGLFIKKCSPRANSGLIIMPNSMFLIGIAGLSDSPLITPSGRKFKYSNTLLKGLIKPKNFKQNWHNLLSESKDVYFRMNDPMPAFWHLVSHQNKYDDIMFEAK